MRMLFSGIRLSVFLLLAAPSALPAVNGRVVADSAGIQVLELWGTNRQMGEALAAFQGQQIKKVVRSLRGFDRWQEILLRSKAYAWNPDQLEVIEAEADALSGVSAAELKAVNAYGDWSYNLCRAYSVWGGLATHGGSVSGRRLMKDGVPPELEKLHAINCFQPADRPAWANFGAPGLVCSATGINEFGYLFALHDHYSDQADTTAGLLTRSGACALVSRAAGPDEAEALLLANPGGTGSYLLFWGGAGKNTGGAVFCYGAAGRLHGGSRRLHRRSPCPEVLGGTALTCGNDSYPVSHDDCGLGGHAAELVSRLELPAYTLAQAEQPLVPCSYHSVYAEARSRREIDFYMWARVEGRQVRTTDLSWEDCFRHSPPVPERLPLRLGRGADSLALRLEDGGLSDAGSIRFDLPAAGYLNLSLFDRGGALVRTLVNHRLQQGAYSVEWDRRDNRGGPLVPGEYLLRLRSARGIIRKACRIE